MGTRLAQELVNNFHNDYDVVRETSRARDIRAMSAVNDILQRPGMLRRSRSIGRNLRTRSLTPVKSQDPHAPLPTAHLMAHKRPLFLNGTTSSPYSHRVRRASSSSVPVAYIQNYSEPYGLDPGYYGSQPIYIPQNNYHPRQGPHHHHHATRHHMHYATRPVGLPAGPTVVEKRRTERSSQNLLDYKLPSADYYHDMKKSLRNLNDKMSQHRILLDRYAGIDLAAPGSVEDRISQKYNQIVDRMPHLERIQAPDNFDTYMYYGDKIQPKNMPTSMGAAPAHNKKLHNKIRKLLHHSKTGIIDRAYYD